MSTPFKMKGWSGNQSPSPIRQPKNLQQSLANIQKNISSTVKSIGTNIRKGIKPQSESSGFGLTDLEKAQAKKLGISEYQYKTGAGISSSTRHKKRTFEKKHGLGRYASKEKDSIDTTETQAKTDIIKPQEISIVTDGKVTGTTSTSSRPEGIGPVTEEFDPEAKESTINTPTDDWITKKGDPWSYRKTDKGYQTRKGDGTVIDVFNKKSKAYKSISEKVFDTKSGWWGKLKSGMDKYIEKK